MLTPAPECSGPATDGFYKDADAEAFIRKFGHADRNDKPNRLNFGGRHVVGVLCPLTGLMMRLAGIHAVTGKITHANGESHSRLPANNRAFWRKKLSGNQARDRLVNRALRRDGWRVVRVWEHELGRPPRVLARVHRALAAGRRCAS